MSSGISKRHRSALALPPGQFKQALEYARRTDFLIRIGLCLLAAILMWGITGAWAPPFSYRTRYTPPRDIVTRVEFETIDEYLTTKAKEKARSEVVCYYAHDPQPLDDLEQALTDRLFKITAAESFDKVDKPLWRDFLPPPDQDPELTPEQQAATFNDFRDALVSDKDLKGLKQAVHATFESVRQNGLLESLQHKLGEGSSTDIRIYPARDGVDASRTIDVAQVRIGEVAEKLHTRLAEELKETSIPAADVEQVADRIFVWLRSRLPTTLKLDPLATKRAADEAEAAVQPVPNPYSKGQKLADMGEPLDARHIHLLQLEHAAYLRSLSFFDMLVYSLADLGMYVALYLLCGFFVYYRERRLLENLRQFATMLSFIVLTVGLVEIVAREGWRGELVPITIFGMTVAIAYRYELALLLASAIALIASLSLGLGLAEFVILVATVASASFFTARIRSRTKLIYVGLVGGAVAFFTTLGVSTMSDQPIGVHLLIDAAWNAMWAVIAGLLMTALLPFIERVFDIQTDISLLELGDAAHPLLQELVRRAPGTYNHSITVASIGEAAAEAIGANGLLVRVGAYFHDIGKMLKPSYFVENQGQGGNRHETLLPAMSTLVIIAHVKDGADLARQHHLPKRIIDFIEQHHGTTLVEYFFDRATKQSEADPDGAEIDETSFRYPGPKPQIRETAVLMVADACESACRALVDPAPARIESLVHDILMKRLLDGQFEECSITLRQLHLIELTIVKSLTAVYHGRVKYPEKQQTA